MDLWVVSPKTRHYWIIILCSLEKKLDFRLIDFAFNLTLNQFKYITLIFYYQIQMESRNSLEKNIIPEICHFTIYRSAKRNEIWIHSLLNAHLTRRRWCPFIYGTLFLHVWSHFPEENWLVIVWVRELRPNLLFQIEVSDFLLPLVALTSSSSKTFWGITI